MSVNATVSEFQATFQGEMQANTDETATDMGGDLEWSAFQANSDGRFTAYTYKFLVWPFSMATKMRTQLCNAPDVCSNTTRTLRTQRGMTIVHYASGDLKLIINELDVDALLLHRQVFRL